MAINIRPQAFAITGDPGGGGSKGPNPSHFYNIDRRYTNLVCNIQNTGKNTILIKNVLKRLVFCLLLIIFVISTSKLESKFGCPGCPTKYFGGTAGTIL